jgi:hypothetical protein
VTLVFVSHGGRDNAPASDPDGESRREPCGLVGMRSCGFFATATTRFGSTRSQLEPGIEWDDAILCGVTTCDFAAILLDKAAVLGTSSRTSPFSHADAPWDLVISILVTARRAVSWHLWLI